MSARKLYKVADVAEEFGVTPVCVRKWIRKGELKAFVTPGGHCRILEEDYTAFVRKYKDAEYGTHAVAAMAMGK